MKRNIIPMVILGFILVYLALILVSGCGMKNISQDECSRLGGNITYMTNDNAECPAGKDTLGRISNTKIYSLCCR